MNRQSKPPTVAQLMKIIEKKVTEFADDAEEGEQEGILIARNVPLKTYIALLDRYHYGVPRARLRYEVSTFDVVL